MQNKLQELTDKLYNEGLSKGRQEGEELLAKARTQADEMIAKAQAEAERIIAAATRIVDSRLIILLKFFRFIIHQDRRKDN